MKKFLFPLILMFFFLACKKSSLSKSTAPVTKPDTTTTKAPTGTTLNFSGYTWNIKDSGTGTAGPGPNNWADANAFVDANGYLHLKLTQVGGKWYCAEVTSTQNFGYGTYQWDVDGQIDSLDQNVVFGLFNYSGVDGYDEMDIEYSKFGSATANNTNFTVYPAQNTTSKAWGTTYNTLLSGGTYTTQRLTRSSDNSSVSFQELGGFQTDNDNLITSAICSSPANSISTLAMPIHMNLWLFRGDAPVNNKQVEIIIHSFTFTAM